MKIENYSVNSIWHNADTKMTTRNNWWATAVMLGITNHEVTAVAWIAGGILHAVHLTSRSVRHYWGKQQTCGTIPNHTVHSRKNPRFKALVRDVLGEQIKVVRDELAVIASTLIDFEKYARRMKRKTFYAFQELESCHESLIDAGSALRNMTEGEL